LEGPPPKIWEGKKRSKFGTISDNVLFVTLVNSFFCSLLIVKEYIKLPDRTGVVSWFEDEVWESIGCSVVLVVSVVIVDLFVCPNVAANDVQHDVKRQQ